MLYKIDTREQFDIITPNQAEIDSNLSEQLDKLINDYVENGRSLLIDLTKLKMLNDEQANWLQQVHHRFYDNNLSFVICCLQQDCLSKIEELELEGIINIAPTLIEAIDLISMEGLEREILGGE